MRLKPETLYSYYFHFYFYHFHCAYVLVYPLDFFPETVYLVFPSYLILTCNGTLLEAK